MDRVLVNLERVTAVFQIVGYAGSFCGELTRLAHGRESCIQAVGQCGTEYESAGLDAEHQVDFFFKVVFGERVDQRGEAELVFEQRGNVIEEDPRLGEIRNFADQLLQWLAIDSAVL